MKIKKPAKITLLVLVMLLLSTLAFASDDINVEIADKSVDFSRLDNGLPMGKPYAENGRTYIPVRVISEDLGYEVSWLQETQTVVIEKEGKKVELKLGESTALVNGIRKPIDVRDGKVVDTKALSKNGRTYVPVRFIAEAMDEEVDYRNRGKDGRKTVYINSTNIPSESEPIVKWNLEIHFIDVDQGDAILIKQDGYNLLIDAGDNAYGQRVVDYLKDNNVGHLDYLIGTHPHADHIGGMDDVINAFSIGKIIMPKVCHTTKTFEDVIEAIKQKGLKITTPRVGDTYTLGESEFTILAPNSSDYENLNNYSIISRLAFGNNSFIFTGDAEEISESETLANGYTLKSDLLKVGHHGSNTSTSQEFLDAVSPKYAVIQVGKDNRYGHPTEDILSRLYRANIEVYRNDMDGDIVVKSDGDNITFSVMSPNLNNYQLMEN